MSILCQVGAQAAAKPPTAPSRAEHDLTTPAPVYTAEPPLNAPARLASHEQMRALAAIRHAKARYPGAVSDVLVDAIQGYKDLGYLGSPTSPVARLIRELMA